MSIDPLRRGMSRRSFLISGSLFIASAAGGLSGCRRGEVKGGAIAGGNWKAGHMLLGRDFPHPGRREKAGIVIVGGGIAGLSAARELMKNRFDDFLLLELEEKAGGNAASGSSAVSAYPWGAHYIPIPGEDAVLVRELFEELGIIEGYDGRGLPVYNEFHLCAEPQERLFIHGHWQEGLVPQLGISERDRGQYEEFFGRMARFREARGSDGRRAFAIPIENSSQDNAFRKYDEISMARYLSDNGWDSEYLRWYINYCCRDDYGCRMEETSAWAGIHYFASRDGGAANADPHAVVTWPEGIGWIVRRMKERMGSRIRCGACVVNVEPVDGGVAVDYIETGSGRSIRVLAGAVVYASPRFTALRTVAPLRKDPPSYAGSFGYAPWMVANITLSQPPDGKGAALSWDNVSYHSGSLGYVVANHQDIRSHRGKTVLTYYLPLTSAGPSEERREALQRSHGEWIGMVLKDLSGMHPGIEEKVKQVDIWLWGHAMVRPTPGFIWGRARREALRPLGRIFFAHSDMSGISIFEEAQFRGVMASRAALRKLHATRRG